MPRAGWIYVGVNMMDDDHRRLEKLAELWGMSKAAAVRRLLKEATPELNPRHGHTCPEATYAKWGTSNPMARERCTICWPTPPTTAERHDGEETHAVQARFGVPWSERAPWWFHVAEARKAAQEEEE